MSPWWLGTAIGVGITLPGWFVLVRGWRRVQIDGLVDRLVERAKSGDYSAVREAINLFAIQGDDWQRILDAYYRTPRPTQERTPMQPTPPAEPHDPLFLKTLLDQLEQGSPARARKWLRLPEKGRKDPGGILSGTGLREALGASRVSRGRFFPVPTTPIANPINWIEYNATSTTAPVENISTTNHT